ncbi:MAG: GNAT family N-acetyltransferase [Nocardioides sp.]|nr:GNAT family N-acetyltransferase [Nocardioides sp.]
MNLDESRFESDPEELVGEPEHLPDGWMVDTPDPADRADVARLTTLLRAHEERGRGWPGAGVDDILLEVSEAALATRENVVVRDPDGVIRAWGGVHDRAGGRMLFVHVVERDLPDGVGRACSDVLVEWAVGQAVEVGSARGLDVQQIDTGAFAADDRQHRWLAAAGFERVRSWWQMSRPVRPEETSLVDSAERWEQDGVVFRLVRRAGSGLPDENDLREIHEVLEGAFVDHFNHFEETFEEFLHRLREEPGHRWDHWWLAELVEDEGRTPVGCLVGEVAESGTGPDGSYVSYLGVLEAARGRGVAKGLLRTIVADAAARGRDRVGLEVDADSSTRADGLYVAMGWETRYVTESWHRDVPVEPV